jgi:ribosomal protein S18 acetylase RimI-like enzyme
MAIQILRFSAKERTVSLPPFSVRELGPSDAEVFWNLRLRALREEPESFGSSYEESLNTPLSEAAKRLESSDEAFVLGAEAPHLVGMVGFYRRPGLKSRHKGTIWGMYVAAESRGQGAGRALLEAAIERALGIPGLEEVLLRVVTNKAHARHLYLSSGFKIYGIEAKALKLGDRYFDEEMMALELKARPAGGATSG